MAAARTAAFIADAPIALISLVDEDRQWFKACVGLGAEETDRRDAFCAYAIVSPESPLIVTDATLDPRFRENPFVVGPPHIRFYCGFPLTSAAGRAFGTLCVIDTVPRTLEGRQLQALRDLADQTSELIQSRTRILELEERVTLEDAACMAVLRLVGEIAERETNLDDVLEQSLSVIVREFELSAGGLWWLDDGHFVADELWVDPNSTLAAVRQSRDGLAIPVHLMIDLHETATRHDVEGLPAVVAAAMRPAGIVTVYAVPIVAGGKPVGIYELISRGPEEPTARVLHAATQAAAEVGRWIDRDRAHASHAFKNATLPTTPVEQPDTAEQIRRRARVKSRLAGAVGRNDISIAYEPIVDIATNRMVGVEALARWHDEELGDVRPDEFISIAEESGGIQEIGAYIRRRALTELHDLDASTGATGALNLWVNVSPHEIDASFVAGVLDDLTACGVAPDRLTLEITERVAFHTIDPGIELIDELSSHGIHIAVDDFGTGFTSLTQLRTLPLARIKIDRSFLADIVGESASRVRPLIAGIVQIGRLLELEVVTEGIETQEQLDAVRELGADLAQGHLFSLATFQTRA
jgi:EAL domain-containing protein (putative c-di-GMP-specific phosphodiesterase class I)/GAF domain-containing protein